VCSCSSSTFFYHLLSSFHHLSIVGLCCSSESEFLAPQPQNVAGLVLWVGQAGEAKLDVQLLCESVCLCASM